MSGSSVAKKRAKTDCHSVKTKDQGYDNEKAKAEDTSDLEESENGAEEPAPATE